MRVLALLLLVPLTALAEDSRVERGKFLALERSRGNCLACHSIGDGEQPGNLGPPLLMMKIRFPERETLRAQICDASLRNPDSRMPPICRHRILTVDEVEMIMDYLYTL